MLQQTPVPARRSYYSFKLKPHNSIYSKHFFIYKACNIIKKTRVLLRDLQDMLDSVLFLSRFIFKCPFFKNLFLAWCKCDVVLICVMCGVWLVWVGWLHKFSELWYRVQGLWLWLLFRKKESWLKTVLKRGIIQI